MSGVHAIDSGNNKDVVVSTNAAELFAVTRNAKLTRSRHGVADIRQHWHIASPGLRFITVASIYPSPRFRQDEERAARLRRDDPAADPQPFSTPCDTKSSPNSSEPSTLGCRVREIDCATSGGPYYRSLKYR